MASKNILKFILKMAVAGLILAAVIYGIMKVTSPKTSQNDILNKSNNLDITEKYTQSYGDEFVAYAQLSNAANKLRIVNANKINNFLLEHYDYYLTLTLFKNKSTDADKEQIFNLMKSLSSQIDSTIEMAELTKVNGLNNDERLRRLANYANEYFKQTKIFLELNEKLKDYVYKVNYGTYSTGIVYEVQLEMVRDYCKVAFESDIFGKYGKENSVDIICSNSESSFSKVIDKFNARQTDNKNGDKEVKFTERYMDISKQTLKEFYEKTEEGARTEKQNYINSITDITVKNNLTFLLDYMTQNQY